MRKLHGYAFFRCRHGCEAFARCGVEYLETSISARCNLGSISREFQRCDFVQPRDDGAGFSLPVHFKSLPYNSTADATKEGVEAVINIAVFRRLWKSRMIKMYRRFLNTIKELENEFFALPDCASEGILVPLELPIGSVKNDYGTIVKEKTHARHCPRFSIAEGIYRAMKVLSKTQDLYPKYDFLIKEFMQKRDDFFMDCGIRWQLGGCSQMLGPKATGVLETFPNSFSSL